MDGATLIIARFRATPYLVDYSTVESYALLVEALGRRLFHAAESRATPELT